MWFARSTKKVSTNLIPHKNDFSKVIVTDESLVTYDGPDRWTKDVFYLIQTYLSLKKGNMGAVVLWYLLELSIRHFWKIQCQ